jgi:uncharacterized phage protein gp47/JayE
MSLEIPESAAEVENRAATDVQRELPESNPRLKNSWLGALITSFANRIFDFYLQLLAALKENLPDTATTAINGLLKRWAAIWGIQTIPASQATGNVVATGTAAAIVPSGTVMTTSSGNYTSTSSATISAQSISVSGIARSGQTATLTTVSDHGLANNVPVTISGAVETEYNVSAAVITVTGLNTFEYQVVGSPSTPATGTILAAFTSASVPIKSDDFGADTNLDAGEELTLQSPIVNVDDTLTVDFGAVGGGTDQETDPSLRTRLLDRIQNPVAHFNESDIKDKAKEVAGVTRVFVQPAGFVIGTAAITSITRLGNVATVTLTAAADFQSGQTVTITGADQVDYNVIDAPILVESTTIFHFIVANTPVTPATGTILSTVTVAIGQVRVFFMRDNDINPIPSGSEVATVKAKIEEILPANTDEDNDLFVLAPIAVVTDFTFSSLTPNTSTMQTAIENNLKAFYAENTSVGVNIDEDAYRSAIFNTVDTETGDVVINFDLSTPTADIVIASDEIGVLGNVVFN